MKKQLLLLLLICISIFAGVEKEFIAVNDLKGRNITDDELVLISNRLRSELFKTGQFRVMERSEMVAIIEEQHFQQSEYCQDNECVVDMGRILGVNSIIAGTVGRIDDFFTITLRVINVETSEVMSAVGYDYTGDVTGLISEGIGHAARELNLKSIYANEAPVSITSKSQNVKVLLNDSLVGETPFSDTLSLGTYTVSLSKKGFLSVTQDFTLESGSEFSKMFKLERENRKARIVRIISASVAASATALGIYTNYKMDEYNRDAQDILAKAEAESDGAKYNTVYQSSIDDVQSMKTIRNVSYSIAGASVVLFGVSFAF